MEQPLLTNEAVSNWQGIQDSLAVLTGLELRLYGMDGPLGRASGESPFCADIKAASGQYAMCMNECSGFAKEALGGPAGSHRFFKCHLGQKVFAVKLGLPDGEPLVLVGGKTFDGREDYSMALAALRAAGVKVQATGRHRYRFIGKKRLDGLMEHVKNAAEQYFTLSMSISGYRLKLNRQAALMENAGLLYHVNEVPTMVDGFMRALDGLFGAGVASIHIFGLGEGEADRHYIRGARNGELVADTVRFMQWLRRNFDPAGGQMVVEGRHALEAAGFVPGLKSALCVPAVISGELVGCACIYNMKLAREDMEALRSYTRQIATAIDNRRLRTGVLEKLKRLKAMSVLYASAGALQDPDEIFRLLLEKSTEIMNAERGSLMLINEKTDELFIRFSKGIHEDTLKAAAARSGEGIAGFVARTGSPIVVRDEDGAGPELTRRPDYKTGSFVSFPLKVRGRVVGVVNVTDKLDGGPFDYEDLEFLLGLASHAGNALERSAFEEQPGEPLMMEEGGLSGLMSWGRYKLRLAEEMERARRYGHSLSLMVMDVNGMDEYRAKHGGSAAAEALRRINVLFLSSLRACDIISRYTEHRFTAALPETTPAKAEALAARLKRRVEAVRFPDAEMADSIRITVGIGVAGFPSDADSPGKLLDAALLGIGDEK